MDYFGRLLSIFILFLNFIYKQDLLISAQNNISTAQFDYLKSQCSICRFFKMLYIFLFTIFSVVFAYEKSMTFTVQAGKVDCFYHEVGVGDVIDIEYQVIDASHGELDVSFQLSDPVGRVIVADYKKPENSHRHTSDLAGDYRFCFDNSFSTFSTKTVFFDMLIQTDEEVSKDYDDDNEMEVVGDAVETYLMKVRDISESVTKVRDNMAVARRMQELHSAHEARDRNLAENLCDSVLSWSAGQIILMLIVGIMQVFFVKSLFEDAQTNKLNKLMTKLSR